MITIPDGFKISGVRGVHNNNTVNAIGFWVSKITYDLNESEEMTRKWLTIDEEWLHLIEIMI